MPPMEPRDPRRWTDRFWRLTFLNILANITVPMVGLVDTAMLGHLDDIRYLGGVALGAVIFDYVFWSLSFLRMATTGLTAQAVGRREPEESERTLRRAAVLALVFGIALLAFREPLANAAFSVLSGDPITEAAGHDYFFARLWGVPAALLNLAFLGWFLGREESRVALWMTVTANTVNLVLDYILIVKLGWAAAGAGYAGAAGQYLMLAVALIFYRGRRTPLGNWRDLVERNALSRLLSLNRDIMIRTLCLGTSFALFTELSSRLGPVALAANTLHLRWISLVAFFIDGVAYAVESLAGIFYGEQRLDTLNRLVKLALLAGVAIAGSMVSLLILFPYTTLGWLTSHTEVVELAVSLRWWLIPVLVVGSAAYVFDGLYLGLTAGRSLRNSMILSALCFVPLALYAAQGRQLQGLWAALSLFMLARVVTLGVGWRNLY